MCVGAGFPRTHARTSVGGGCTLGQCSRRQRQGSGSTLLCLRWWWWCLSLGGGRRVPVQLRTFCCNRVWGLGDRVVRLHALGSSIYYLSGILMLLFSWEQANHGLKAACACAAESLSGVGSSQCTTIALHSTMQSARRHHTHLPPMHAESQGHKAPAVKSAPWPRSRALADESYTSVRSSTLPAHTVIDTDLSAMLLAVHKQP